MTWSCKVDATTAIAVFAYNRPSHLRRVLIALEDYKINKIFVFLDGPRNINDKINQKEIKYTLNRNKRIKITLVTRKKNFGLKKSIISGLDFLSNFYKKIIIIEDDCIPRKEFFAFINANFKFNLMRDEVACICGYQSPNIHNEKSKKISTLLLNFFIPWGWAILSKSWLEYRKNFKFILKKKNLLKKKIPKILLKLIEINEKNKKIWSIDFMVYNFIKKKFYIFPSKSLVKNIGFDGSGINSKISFNFNTRYSPSNNMECNPVTKKKFINEQKKFILKNLKYYY